MFQKLLRRRLPVSTGILPPETDDDMLVEIWLLTVRSLKSQEAYRYDIALFRDFVPLPFREMKLPDLQRYQQHLGTLALKPATIARRLKSLKSLLSFALRTGYCTFNVGAMIILPKPKKTLSERILVEEQVLKMLYLEEDPRNHLLLRVLYASGGRVSEICGLSWRDVQPNGETGQITIYGKGDETRAVVLSSATYEMLKAWRGPAGLDDPVFCSVHSNRYGQAGGRLTRSQVLRIVRKAARRAGIAENVSPHWLRHAHASHSLEKGASIALVQATLGHQGIETTAQYTHAKPNDSSGLRLSV